MGWGTRVIAGVVLGAGLVSLGCDDRSRTVGRETPEAEAIVEPTQGNEVPTAGVPPVQTVIVDGGGEPITVDVDAGEELPFDAGIVVVVVDAGTPDAPDAGPWPVDAVRDYTAAFGVGKPQSVAFDEGLNLWLLDGERIGILRPGDTSPKWTHNIGQAKNGFGLDQLATRSTVICGGEAGRAYVGYAAPELQPWHPEVQRAYIPWPGEPHYSAERFAEYMKGDLDAVRVNADGTIALEEHIWRTIGPSNANKQVGIHNTNDFHWEEDRSVFGCERITRGPHRGDVYITTNHGVTHIKGLTYNSHRHPGWYKTYTMPDGSTAQALQCTAMHGLGIGHNGDVLVANEQMVGALVPTGHLPDWDRENTFNGPVPWRFKFHNHELNGLEAWDHWRAFEQTTSGKYYLGSEQYGLWEMTAVNRSTGSWKKFAGLSATSITALIATDDGALYVGTESSGLWRLEADGTTIARVTNVPGSRVKQLVYEPTVTPRMLAVVTDSGVTVLRGP